MQFQPTQSPWIEITSSTSIKNCFIVSFLPLSEPKTPILIPSKKFCTDLCFKFQKTKIELPEYYAQILLALPPVQINTSHCCPWRGDKNSCRGGKTYPRTGSEANSLYSGISPFWHVGLAGLTGQGKEVAGGRGELNSLTLDWALLPAVPNFCNFVTFSSIALEIPMGIMEFLNHSPTHGKRYYRFK